MNTLLNAALTSSTPMTTSEGRLSQPEAVPMWRNPTQLERPSYLLSFPFSLSTQVANNPWMEDLPGDRRYPNSKRACVQFLELYRYLAGEALVYVLPTPQTVTLQDQVFTANLGIVLEHVADKNTIIISNFTSEPRRGETQVGVEFFQQMGYRGHRLEVCSGGQLHQSQRISQERRADWVSAVSVPRASATFSGGAANEAGFSHSALYPGVVQSEDQFSRSPE